jgi:hypothetical protein
MKTTHFLEIVEFILFLKMKWEFSKPNANLTTKIFDSVNDGTCLEFYRFTYLIFLYLFYIVIRDLIQLFNLFFDYYSPGGGQPTLNVYLNIDNQSHLIFTSEGIILINFHLDSLSLKTRC